MLESISQPCPPTVITPMPSEMRPYSKRQQLMQEMLGDSELLLKNRLEVRHLMTPNPVTITPTMTLEEMTKQMTDRRVHHLLVCGRNGEVVGVVSDRDLHSIHSTTAQQVMSFPVLSCTSDTPVSAAITYLLNENISCLPVVDNGQLCGILTTTDLILTLQCMLQMWLRFSQVLQHDQTWSKELDKIVASLDGVSTAQELAERVTAARQAIRQEVQDIVNVVDLHVDALTGMSNRQELEEILSMVLAVKKRYERPFSLAIVSIDYFERIRENCGDAVVKPLLKAVARLIEREVRTSDFVARCRENAFAVVLMETPLDAANEFCVRLQNTARDRSKLDMKLRISVRAVEATADDTVETLLDRAESVVSA